LLRTAVKILIVEDGQKLARFLVRVLSEEGYVVDLAMDGEQALEQAQAAGYDLVVLDWMLPGLDGLSVCRELRKAGDKVPILMLTARGQTQERVLGLDSGADDFLPKPFEVEELVARVRALLRRSTGFTELRCGPLQLNRSTREVLLGGQPLELTTREYALLLHLAHHANRVVKRTELLDQVWHTGFDPGSNIVEVQVSRLRDKLGPHAKMIETVRGVGYRLKTEPSG
jgi:DNA-binding response OmpR family regulator